MSREGLGTFGKFVLIIVGFMVVTTVVPLCFFLIPRLDLALPQDIWSPARTELAGGFAVAGMGILLGTLLLVVATRAQEPSTVSLAISRIWGFGFFLAGSGIILALRYSWVLLAG